MLKRIWHDPVWSKVIAAIIFAALTGIAGIAWDPIRVFLVSTSPIPNWLTAALILLIVVLGAILFTPRQTAVARISPVGDAIIGEDKAPGRGFPLKVYRVVRNDSNDTADISVADYKPGTVSPFCQDSSSNSGSVWTKQNSRKISLSGSGGELERSFSRSISSYSR
jgi:hypothetical protein